MRAETAKLLEENLGISLYWLSRELMEITPKLQVTKPTSRTSSNLKSFYIGKETVTRVEGSLQN